MSLNTILGPPESLGSCRTIFAISPDFGPLKCCFGPFQGLVGSLNGYRVGQHDIQLCIRPTGTVLGPLGTLGRSENTKFGSSNFLAFCKNCLPDLVRGYSCNNDSVNCSEISAVTWFRKWSGLVQFPKNTKIQVVISVAGKPPEGADISSRQESCSPKNGKIHWKKVTIFHLRMPH